MRFELTRDHAQFARRAAPVLAERLDANVIATILLGLEAGAFPGSRPVFAWGVDPAGEVRAAALRTPPWYMVCSEIEPDAADRLVGLWLEDDPDLPGVNAVPETARAIAAAWAARTGGSTRCRMHEAMHVLDRVADPPRPAPGTLRVAGPEDRSLLVAWMDAFIVETGITPGSGPEAMVDSKLSGGNLLIWEDGRPVSLVAINPAVAGVVRIGPVYTPPEHRRRGYAGSAVAGVSRRALAAGCERCMLFTDLANPTSNKIYAEVGFRRISGWEEHEFDTAGASRRG